jgi:hypothetical protein
MHHHKNAILLESLDVGMARLAALQAPRPVASLAGEPDRGQEVAGRILRAAYSPPEPGEVLMHGVPISYGDATTVCNGLARITTMSGRERRDIGVSLRSANNMHERLATNMQAVAAYTRIHSNPPNTNPLSGPAQ